MPFLKKLVIVFSLEQTSNGMNPFRDFIYFMNPTYEQNTGSNGECYLNGFTCQWSKEPS